MGLFGKTSLFEARIALWNLDEADVAAGEPILATVEADPDATSALPRPGFAYLVPLTAVTLLRNSHANPETTAPIMEVLALATDEIRGGEDQARSLRVRELAYPNISEAVGLDGEADPSWLLRVGVPELDTSADGSPTKVMRTQVVEGRRGAVFATMRGIGNSYQAAYGFFALLEHMARTQPYDEVVSPAAGALAEISLFYSEVLEDHAPSFSVAGKLNELVCLRMAGAISDD